MSMSSLEPWSVPGNFVLNMGGWICIELQDRVADYISSVDELDTPKKKTECAEAKLAAELCELIAFPDYICVTGTFFPFIFKVAHQ